MSNNWKNILLSPLDKIRDALDKLNAESLRIALVINEEKKLIGVITDGDIRRALLNNFNLDSEVCEIMNTAPVTAECDTSREELVSIMQKADVLSIPLLDNGVLVGLEELLISRSENKLQNPIFIMAGGFGTRLSPLTDTCPKPLLKIGGKPILEIALDNFIKAGYQNFYISLHYLPDQIRDYFGDGSRWNVNIQYVYEERPLGTGGALSLLPDDISDLPLIMINGDILTTIDLSKLIEFHEEHRGPATMCVREYEHQVPFGVVTGDGKKIVSMVEKPVQRSFVNAGIYVINSEVRNRAIHNTYLDMPTLLENIINEGGGVHMFPIHEYWLDIGQINDFKRAQIDFLTLGIDDRR